MEPTNGRARRTTEVIQSQWMWETLSHPGAGFARIHRTGRIASVFTSPSWSLADMLKTSESHPARVFLTGGQAPAKAWWQGWGGGGGA